MAKNKERIRPERSQAQQVRLAARLLSSGLLHEAKAENKFIQEDKPFTLLIDNIKLLSLSAFIKCYTSGDLSALILFSDGEPNEWQLSEAWETLKNQYFDTSGNTIAKAANERQKRINTYIVYINRVRMLADAVSVYYDERLVAELQEDGFDYPFIPETLEHDLRLVCNELIGWEVKKQELEQLERDEMENSRYNIAEITEEYFLEQLAELRKFEGYNTPVTRLAEEMTVFDYCLAMKRYNENITRVNAQNNITNGNR